MSANAEVKEEVKRKYGSAARAVAERGKPGCLLRSRPALLRPDYRQSL